MEFIVVSDHQGLVLALLRYLRNTWPTCEISVYPEKHNADVSRCEATICLELMTCAATQRSHFDKAFCALKSEEVPPEKVMIQSIKSLVFVSSDSTPLRSSRRDGRFFLLPGMKGSIGVNPTFNA